MITMFLVSAAPTRPLAVIAVAASLIRIACSITTVRHGRPDASLHDQIDHDAQR